MFVCAKVVAFLVSLGFFALLFPRHYKIGFWGGFEQLNFRFFWVNIEGSITWPPKGQQLGHFFPDFLGEMLPS